MHTQNVNVKSAGEETAGRWIKNPSPLPILIAEGEKNSTEEMDVLEFDSLASLKSYRSRAPEKMKRAYHYIVSAGVDKDFCHVPVVEADHFKQFVRLIARNGINI